jgi:hypothetical protein
MITALALHSGRVLSEFELIGLTTDPDVIAHVLPFVEKVAPHLVPPRRKASRRASVRAVPTAAEPEVAP